jgi:xylitol oxidase
LRQPDAVARLLQVVEDALAPFAPKPHWGKLFIAEAAVLETRYERLADFRRLAETLDPRGAFRNDFLERHVWG